mmetsp:Transcript_49759/g.96119  ORF Transcript_49759/g.96119 Transcript_49759/m.96119 type:complete len:372 (+) Transcript_49759:145-1260(+)
MFGTLFVRRAKCCFSVPGCLNMGSFAKPSLITQDHFSVANAKNRSNSCGRSTTSGMHLQRFGSVNSAKDKKPRQDNHLHSESLRAVSLVGSMVTESLLPLVTLETLTMVTATFWSMHKDPSETKNSCSSASKQFCGVANSTPHRQRLQAKRSWRIAWPSFVDVPPLKEALAAVSCKDAAATLEACLLSSQGFKRKQQQHPKGLSSQQQKHKAIRALVVLSKRALPSTPALLTRIVCHSSPEHVSAPSVRSATSACMGKSAFEVSTVVAGCCRKMRAATSSNLFFKRTAITMLENPSAAGTVVRWTLMPVEVIVTSAHVPLTWRPQETQSEQAIGNHDKYTEGSAHHPSQTGNGMHGAGTQASQHKYDTEMA